MSQTPTTSAAPAKEIQIKGPHARRRFAKQLVATQAALQQSLAPADGTLPAHAFYKHNGRTPLFMLQGLARVYGNLGIDDAFFDALKVEAKIIEDALGAVDFWWVTAQKLSGWGLPAGTVRLAQDKHTEACGRAWGWLEAKNWVAHRYEEELEPHARVLARKLKRVEWPSPRKEARALRAWLVEELQDAHDDLLGLDMRDIEGGLHEARRKARWFSIYAAALEGAFVLDHSAAAPEGWDRYLQPEIVNSPFNKLAEPEPKDKPISLPAPLFYGLSFIIDRLGALKDRAQWTETVLHLLARSGEKPERGIQEHLGETYLSPEDAAHAAAALVDQVFVKDKLLPRLIEALDQGE